MLTIPAGKHHRAGNTPFYRAVHRVYFARWPNSKNNTMLRWVLTFFVMATIAATPGFTGIAGAAADIVRIPFFVFLVLLVLSAPVHVLRRKPTRLSFRPLCP
jgi:uncharacterized membrane protein YtjA (UPF0391 family)